MNDYQLKLYVSEVRSVEDDQGGLRIKVRISPIDDSITWDDELPYCFPLLPKMFHTNPKKNEAVVVFISNTGLRFFIGPIISQEYGLNYEPFYTQARSLFPNSIGVPYTNPDNLKDSKGTYPERDDVAIQGRQNTLIDLKDNELRILCGHKKNPTASHPEDRLVFNREDLGYIRMKYEPRTSNDGRDYSSSIDIVADRINLLTHDSSTIFNLNNPDELITKDVEKSIQSTAHPMIYGDELVGFLKELITLFRNHVHPFAKLPCIFNEGEKKTLNTDLDKMLSLGVKFN